MAFGWFHQFTYGRLWTLLKDTVAAWSEGKVPRYDATLAYVKEVGRHISLTENATVAGPTKAQGHELSVVVPPSFAIATYVPSHVVSNAGDGMGAGMPCVGTDRWIFAAMLGWALVRLFMAPSGRHGNDANKAL